MSNKDIADKFVSAGMGKANQIYPDGIGRFYQVDPDDDWQNSVNASKFVSTLLESIDIPVFLEYVWPGEWQKYEDIDTAFFDAISDMTPAELKKELDESGCRYDEKDKLELEQQKQQWWASLDADQEYINSQCKENQID